MPHPPAVGQHAQLEDLSSYDSYMVEVPGSERLVNIVRHGQPLGQLQFFTHAFPYTLAALCKCDTRKDVKCSRMRSHKVATGESIQDADRVLCKWIIDAHLHATGKAHQQAPCL